MTLMNISDEEIDLDKYIPLIKKIIIENWLVIILLLLLLLSVIYSQTAITGCNAHYQKILKDCIMLPKI